DLRQALGGNHGLVAQVVLDHRQRIAVAAAAEAGIAAPAVRAATEDAVVDAAVGAALGAALLRAGLLLLAGGIAVLAALALVALALLTLLAAGLALLAVLRIGRGHVRIALVAVLRQAQ